MQRASELGNYALRRLKNELVADVHVSEVRGWGLEIGVEIVKDKRSKKQDPELAEKIQTECLEKGLHIVWSGRTSTMMVMPPLVISLKDLDKGLEVLVSVIKKG